MAEVIIAINTNSTLFKARFADNSNSILLYPVAYDAEIIQVGELRVGDDTLLYANNLFKFPTDEFSYIALYQNSKRLREKAKNAELETSAYASWNITSQGNIVISVDGTPAQDRLFSLTDFSGAPSFASLSVDDWVSVFNTKFAGLTATATPSQTIKMVSNKSGSESSIEVTGGTLLDKWFPNLSTSSFGQTAEFQLNRQTGNLRILNDIAPGDTITAGIQDAKGYAISSQTNSGLYNLSTDSAGRPTELVVVIDSTYCNKKTLVPLIGSTLDIAINPLSTNQMIVTSSVLDTFASLQPGDYIYLTKKTTGWLNDANAGMFKIVSKGNHTVAGSDSYIVVNNVNAVAESGIIVDDSVDIKAFSTDGYPQIWRGSYLVNPAAESINNVIDSLNIKLIGVKASLFRSKYIKLTSTTENSGSIAIPVANGNASTLFEETSEMQSGNPPHIANKVSDKTLSSFFKRTTPVSSNVWLDRSTYTDRKGNLTSDFEPTNPLYGEIVDSPNIAGTSPNYDVYDSYVSFTRGNNKGQFHPVKEIFSANSLGTQPGTANTELDLVVDDEFEMVEPLSISSEDSIVFVMDNDAATKTIDIPMSRTGLVNSGSVSSFIPTTTEFSANDYDNEPGINFSNVTVWGTTINSTDFSDYAIWMRARNWYAAEGLSSGLGQMLVRSAQYGPNGNNLRFSIDYPETAEKDPTTIFSNTPSYSTLSYIFGSGPAHPIVLSYGDTISVSGPYPDTATNFPSGASSSGNYYDYTFSSGNFSSINVGDVLSIISGSGVSTQNSGQFRVANKNGLTLRVFNPDATVTSPGSQEQYIITTIADVVGTPTSYEVTTTSNAGGALHLDYFIIYDTAGSVAVWYDVNNTGAPPPSHGADRAIKVATLINGDTASEVATKTGQALMLDSAFTVGVISNQITITNTINGLLSASSTGTTTFSISDTFGTDDNSINGKYFKISDQNGSVAVWFDVNSQGTTEPFHGADRSIKIDNISAGDSANTIAAAIATILNLDAEFSASALLNVVTVNSSTDGNLPDADSATSGFSVSSTDGSLGSPETILNTNLISSFPLAGSDIATIASTVNSGNILRLVAVGSDSLTVTKATREEDYVYGGNSTALAYNHDPSNVNTRGYISLYDGENWIKSFQNSNPNFTLKTTLTLNGVAPSIYSMDTCPNDDTADVGEFFKLIPKTVKNVHHHLTQKALSQLPIVANVSISNDRRNVQVVSKNLGSSGSIEVVGGRANKAEAYTIGESEVTTDMSGNSLLLNINAYPDTFNVNDVIKIENDSGVKRLSRLSDTDTIDVTSSTGNVIEYHFNPKSTNFTSTTQFTIADVSGSYSKPAGTVWRWTHDGLNGASLAQVNVGDAVFAFGGSMSWDQGNKAKDAGDAKFAGLPIINVNDLLNYFDVVNPNGKSMSLTSVGVGNAVQICPTPVIKWTLAHSARVNIASISSSGGIVTVITLNEHGLNTGDNVDIIDSDTISDGSYGPVTVTSTKQFQFSGSVLFTESEVGASAIKSGKVPTRYRLEKLKVNGLIRISREDGDSPRFADCGVAVDDYVVIGGDTFSSNNNGRYRVIGVDNNSIIIDNEQATEEINTYVPFNNRGLQANWVSNSVAVTGTAGTFKYVNIGDWVKKPEDSDLYYRQVVGFNTGIANTATIMTLGDRYLGSTATAPGISYDQLSDYDKGVVLQNVDDLSFYEGDSAVIEDTLYVQNIVNANWFNVNNIGSFTVTEIGVNPATYKPFIRVSNAAGIAESNILMSVEPAGLYLIEGVTSKFVTYRQIKHAALDDNNQDRRSLYVTPHNRSYKFSSANKTKISHMGKLGYSTDVTMGIDGYLYYTGLLRRVQRIVDGYEPDSRTYPGRRAIGGVIEILPPLIKDLSIAVDVTTNEGVNLGDISNNIKSVIINYIQGLGVGEDVILSEIIASIMQIKGVAAVTFFNPTPSTERITIANNEKATISPDNIGIA